MWTQSDISDWADNTFGEVEGWVSLVDRVQGEVNELMDAAREIERVENPYVYEELADNLVEEAADIVIVLQRVFDYLGIDMQDAINKKMKVNVKRNWVKTGKGHGQHV